MDKAARAALLTAKRKDNKSENIADYVADLLRQGRASEVTDDLMAQADPQRLHHHYTSGNTGMDLPMDQASRMERAKQMGFDTKAYHGTNTSKEFSSFGKSVNSKRRETYLAPEEHKDFANSFSSSDQGRVFPLLANVSGFHNGRTEEGREALKDLAYEKNFQPELYANHLKGDPNTLRPVSWGDQNSIDKLNEAGYPGAVIEERPWMDSYAVFDPTKVRSQFARFDPRLEHLAHLSASTGGAMEFARHVEAVHRAGGQIAPSKYLPSVPRQVHAGGGKVDFVKDNPGGEWLEHKQARAAQYPDRKFMTGSTTGVIGGRSNLFLPTHILKGIAGLNDEVRTAGVHKYDSLLSDAQKGGFDPDQQGNKVVVAVNHYGQPYLLEGNTRVAVAHAMGIPKVKAEVRYWNGAENVDGPMHPEKVFGMASSDPDITKAGGGTVDDNEDDGITAYHASPEDIVGQFRPSARDVGIHFAANPDLAKNAAVKSLMGRPDIAEKVSPKAFKINARPEQIVDIPAASNRFDFYDILDHLHGAGRINSDTFNRTYDGLQDIEDKISDPNETMRAQNVLFSKALSKANIKALRYMNKFDAGPTWKDMEEGRMTSHVTPDHSYIVTDPSAIQQQAVSRAAGGRIHANGGGTMDLRSKAAQVISGLKGEKGLAEDMIRAAKSAGVKDAEIANAKPPSGKISRDELAQHFESAVPKIKVTRLGAPDIERMSNAEITTLNRLLEKRENDELAPVQEQRLKELFSEFGGSSPAYEDEQLPHGQNYREHLLSLPDDRGRETFYSSHWGDPNVLAHVRLSDRTMGDSREEMAPIAQRLASHLNVPLRQMASGAADVGVKSGVISPEEAATLSRFMGWRNGYEAKKGIEKKILHVEELQSDWNSEARKHGFKTGNEEQEYDDYVAGMRQKMIDKIKAKSGPAKFNPETGEVDPPMSPMFRDGLIEKYQKMHPSDLANNLGVSAEHRKLDLARYKGVPRAPYIDPDSRDVENLALKHVMTEAAKGGYDGITFTPGSEQSARWGGTDFGDIYDRILPSMATKLARQHDKEIAPDRMNLPSAQGNGAPVSAPMIPLTDTARQSILKNGFGAFKRGGTVGKEDGGAMGDGITAYHGSPYSFDQFDISKLGTGEGNQSYGHGLYFAGNEKVAKYYRDALTDPEQTHLHFDQRPVDTPWNEEIRARWPEHFAGKSQRDQDAMEEALGNLSQVNNLKDVPNALSNMSAAAKYMYQRHIKPKLTKPDLGKGHMYKVQLQVKPSELLDWDKPLSEQHPEVQKALNENLRKSNNLKKFMIENPTGGELHEALSDKGSYRDQISASEQLLAAGLKGIKYRDADSRDLSDGDATHNYVMFHHDPIKVMSKYEYGGTVDRALALTRRFTKDGKAATASLKKKPL